MAKFKGKTLIGLDIGSKCIKAVELTSTAEGVVLTAYGYSELSQEKPLADSLKEVISTGGFKTNKVVTAVSGRSVIVRYINMPEMPDDELRNAIKYEASKYIPFEVDEVMIDCQRLEGSRAGETEEKPVKDEEMRVLLVAVKRNSIDEHVNVLESAGLWPMIIDVDSFALGNAFELHTRLGTESEAKGMADKVMALVDVGASKTNINIIQGLNSYFTREIYLAGNDFTEAISKKMGLELSQAESLKHDPGLRLEEVKEITSSILDDLCHEIHLSFDYFENQFDKPVEYLYISGGGSQLIGLDETFEKTFNKKPIPWNPADHLEIAESGVDVAAVKDRAMQLSIAVGLAARGWKG